jgi:hypothetical protein
MVFVLFLVNLGIAVGFESDESVSEDRKMFDLVRGSLSLAMGRSEAEESLEEEEERMVFGIFLSSASGESVVEDGMVLGIFLFSPGLTITVFEGDGVIVVSSWNLVIESLDILLLRG